MNDFQYFLTVFIKRSLLPFKRICVFIYKLLPLSFHNKIGAPQLLFTRQQRLMRSICGLAIYCLLLAVMLVNYFLPRNKIMQSQLAASRWPLSVNSHLQIAETYFNNNDLKNAKSELEKAKYYYKYLKILDIFGKTNQNINKANKLINTPDEIQTQISHLEEFLQNTPDVRDIHLHLSLLYYQLKNDEQAIKNWDKAFYLDPNNETVQEIGKELNKF